MGKLYIGMHWKYVIGEGILKAGRIDMAGDGTIPERISVSRFGDAHRDGERNFTGIVRGKSVLYRL